MADDLKPSPVAFPAGLLSASALREPAPAPLPMPPAADITVTADGPVDGVTIDPKTGAAQIELEDGGVLVDFSPQSDASKRPSSFGENLAEKIDDNELARIAEDLLRGVQTDEQSRQEWLETRAQGIRLLGLRVEVPSGTNGSDSSTAVPGQSTVRHPLLLEATLRFQANARGELLPAAGPVKVADKTNENGQTDLEAEGLENDLNYYLTTVATEYYPDSDRALFNTGFGGCSFKKVYNCPIRQRPVSESIDAKDIVVSNAATDLRNSGRVTHIIRMRPSIMRRMQLAEAYRDIPLTTPNPDNLNPVDQEVASVQGVVNLNQLPEDRDYTIYEVYCELNIKGFEDKDRGKETGLALPYRVAIDKDSRKVLEVRRNWEETDERKLAKLPFVKFPFVPGLGFYDIGFIHILGNTTSALTAAWREMLDAGMFANFPGFLYAKALGRQNTNELRVPPGGGVGIDTQGMKIGDAVMPLPYKDVSPTFNGFITQIADTGQRLGGTAEVQVGEGKQDAPVGTTLALIEQATKIESAVHKRLHAAQSEEFGLLKECFRQNPTAFIESVRRKGSVTWDEQRFLAALENAAIVPVADPNTPTHMHRLMKTMGMVQLDKAYPGVFQSREVALDAARILNGGSIEPRLIAPPAPPQAAPSPEIEALQIKGAQDAAKNMAQAKDNQTKLLMQSRESADQAAERESREKIADTHLLETVIDAKAKQTTERQPTGQRPS
jgi:hypothetical protein